jgi:Mn2+/Fe2+ NRAMP family transporter
MDSCKRSSIGFAGFPRLARTKEHGCVVAKLPGALEELVLAAPVMMAMMLIVRNPRAMGRLTLSAGMTLLGWFATVMMVAASTVFFYFLLV